MPDSDTRRRRNGVPATVVIAVDIFSVIIIVCPEKPQPPPYLTPIRMAIIKRKTK